MNMNTCAHVVVVVVVVNFFFLKLEK